MKCHSLRIISNFVEEDWSNSTNYQEQVMDSQSNNKAAAPSRKKRSRRLKRYMENNTTSSSFSIANASPSVYEIDQEQQEVAMSLIMLSRDASYRVGLNSAWKSSDNNSEFLEARPCTQTPNLLTRKICVSKSGEFVKLKTLRNGKLEYTVLDSGILKSNEKHHELSAFMNSRNESEITKLEIPSDENIIEISEVKHGESVSKDLDLNHPNKLTHSALDAVSKSKFECSTCNKTFHSYQALGGHRASHKKIKGCFASKIDKSGNSIETQESPDTTDDSNHSPIDNDMLAAGHIGTVQAKKNRVYECKICFKIFPSGQALGGHKRSHSIAEAKASSQTIVVQKPIAEIRDFIDLNLPAPVEEESSSNVDGFKPWSIESIYKHHEPHVGFLSN